MLETEAGRAMLKAVRNADHAQRLAKLATGGALLTLAARLVFGRGPVARTIALGAVATLALSAAKSMGDSRPVRPIQFYAAGVRSMAVLIDEINRMPSPPNSLRAHKLS